MLGTLNNNEKNIIFNIAKRIITFSLYLEDVTLQDVDNERIRHLIVHLEKEPTWLLIQRKSQISCKFGESAELSLN